MYTFCPGILPFFFLQGSLGTPQTLVPLGGIVWSGVLQYYVPTTLSMLLQSFALSFTIYKPLNENCSTRTGTNFFIRLLFSLIVLGEN